jgi:uncharacterized protein YecT (DUF1311 family)
LRESDTIPAKSLCKKGIAVILLDLMSSRRFNVSIAVTSVAWFLVAAGIFPAGSRGSQSAFAQDSPSPTSAPIVRAPPSDGPQLRTPQPQETPVPAAQAPASNYDKAIFQKPIPADQLTFLKQFSGATSNDVINDKQFRKLLKNILPSCMFHYGKDKGLDDALDEVIKGSRNPVLIRDGRYFMISGQNGPYLSGKGFIWIDMQDGVGLGGFYFHPTNGEPTPSVNIFSRQIKKEDVLALSELPPAFAEDLAQWTAAARVSPVTTRYFITGSDKKILLEHDEDFCSPTDGTVARAGDVCEQMNADAADLDMNAAYYLDQVHHATNATAWMITGADQVAFIEVRNRSCGGVLDPLGCRIRMTRQQTHIVVRGSGGAPHSGHR